MKVFLALWVLVAVTVMVLFVVAKRRSPRIPTALVGRSAVSRSRPATKGNVRGRTFDATDTAKGAALLEGFDLQPELSTTGATPSVAARRRAAAAVVRDAVCPAQHGSKPGGDVSPRCAFAALHELSKLKIAALRQPTTAAVPSEAATPRIHRAEAAIRPLLPGRRKSMAPTKKHRVTGRRHTSAPVIQRQRVFRGD